MQALTTSGQEALRISRQAPEISAQPARNPPEPLALQLTGKHLLPTPLYESLHFDVLQYAWPCHTRGCAGHAMGNSSNGNQSRLANLKEGWKSLSQPRRWVGSLVCLCACPDVPSLAHFALVFGFYAAFPNRVKQGSVLLTPNNDSRNDMVWSRRRGPWPASAKCLQVQTGGFQDLWWWFHGIFLGIPVIFWHWCKLPEHRAAFLIISYTKVVITPLSFSSSSPHPRAQL